MQTVRNTFSFLQWGKKNVQQRQMHEMQKQVVTSHATGYHADKPTKQNHREAWLSWMSAGVLLHGTWISAVFFMQHLHVDQYSGHMKDGIMFSKIQTQNMAKHNTQCFKEVAQSKTFV